jgi:hypothetical protein
VLFRVTDNGQQPLSADVTVQIRIANVNRAPVISAPNDNAEFNGREGEQLVIDVFRASDPDGQNMNWTVQVLGGMNGHNLQSNNQSATLTWTPNFNQAGRYNPTIRCSDVNNPVGFDDVPIVIIIADVNRAPVAGNQNPADIVIDEDTQRNNVNLAPTITDPDQGDALTFELVGSESGTGHDLDRGWYVERSSNCELQHFG